jgi:phage-related holin
MIRIDNTVDLCFKYFIASVASITGYFFPIKDIVHVMLLFFIFDVLVGYWAARKRNNAKFHPLIVWKKTVPRMVLSTVLVMMLFMWDDVSEQSYVSTSNLVGWFINGLLIISIMENAYYITEWKVFNLVKGIIRDKIEKETNQPIDEPQ